MDIRDNLALIVKEKAFVQAEIARRAGLTPMKFGAVLAKKRKLDANELFRICNVIAMTPEAIANYRTESAPDNGQT